MAIKIPRIRKKNSWQTKLARLAVGLVVLAIITFLVISNFRIYNNRVAVDDQVKKLQEQIRVLEEQRTTLKAGLNATQGENFQEEKMREQGYKKPGEEVIAVLRDGSSGATKQSETTDGDNFWVDLWGKIKNIKP